MEMKKKLIVLFSLMLVMVLMTGCFGLFAESKINSQLDNLASGMKNMDTDKISSTFASEVEINSNLGSTTVSKSELVDLWEDSFQTMKNEGAEYIKYKYTNRTISVSGDTATAAVTEELEIEYSEIGRASCRERVYTKV